MKTLPPTYDPSDHESAALKRWADSGYANPDRLPGAKRRKSFTIAMPPPNVTGELHVGHALDLTTQDILTRWKRMDGFAALWLPGTDHAGIATQILVERALKENHISRYEIGRETFLKHVWQWKERSGTRIVDQIRRMGASCDWTRERFTMDPQLTAAVHQAFLRLYDDGLIYRGERIIHWCPDDRTGISDLEVEFRQESGTLWFIRYPLVDGDQAITVATTRPETMLGDTAVAVHPKDERYAELIGRTVRLPLVDRTIPIVADAAVDRTFGTGAVKVTPAHDQLDFEIGERHRLERVSVIGLDNRMTIEAGEFAGLPVREARTKIVDRLRALGLLVREEPHQHNVAYCSRSNTLIEPVLSKQWFVKTKPLAARALRAIRSRRTSVVPVRYSKLLVDWLKNIRDWNISRQLWWGHRLPIWYCVACDTPVASIAEPRAACAQCGDRAFRQDEDTLDTWFSSGLWTFSTLGWPKQTSDLRRFHPTDVLGTGWDILFFWVARMMMFSTYLLNEAPFRTVYLHGLVRNAAGEKMSKSKGTGVDPLIMADRYGTDALRLALVVGTAPGLDFRMTEDRVAGQRNFCNKLWNINRYVLAQPEPKSKTVRAATLADRWILARLNETARLVSQHLGKFQFGLAVEALQEFLWRDYADWYVEIHKREKNTAVLRHVLRQSLILLHPFAPFISETIWQTFGEKRLLMIEPWPKSRTAAVKTATKKFQEFQRLVVGLRNLKKHGADGQPLTVALRTTDAALIAALANVTIDTVSGETIRLGSASVTAAPNVVAAFRRWRASRTDELQRYLEAKRRLMTNERAPDHVRSQAKDDFSRASRELLDV